MTLGTENRDFAGHKFSVVTGRRGRHPIGHPPIIQIEPTSKIRSRARSQRAYRRRTAGRIIAAVELGEAEISLLLSTGWLAEDVVSDVGAISRAVGALLRDIAGR